MADIVRKKHGGRSAGTPNVKKQELRALLAEKFPDYHPVISLAEIANDHSNDINTRLQAHKEVAKYIEPQLKAIELTGKNGEQLFKFPAWLTMSVPTAPDESDV